VGACPRALTLGPEDGAALSVVGPETDMEARALGLGDALHAMVEAARLGSRLTFDGARLLLDGRVGVDLGSAVAWDPRLGLAAAGPLLDPERARAAIGLAVAEVVAAGRPLDGIRGEGPFAVAFQRLRSAKGFPACVVGLGPGSTPAGDDYIAGYLCAADALAGTPGEAEPRLREAVAGQLGRTSAAGRSLLLGALAGAPPAYLARLALACVSGDRDAIREAARHALGRGASSGWDALDGFRERCQRPTRSKARARPEHAL